MSIPVAVPGTALVITNTDTANAEALLTLIVQIIKNGTTGATLNTPGLTNSPGVNQAPAPINLATAAAQSLYRTLAVALVKTFSGSFVSFSHAEIPAGTINGTNGTDGNTDFIWAHAPSPQASLIFVKEREFLLPGIDFTWLNSTTIRFASGHIPMSLGAGGPYTERIFGWYQY